MKRRGFLLAEFTLKTVVALICILLLAALLVKMYTTFSKRNQVEQASATLDRLREGMNVAYKGTPYSYVMTGPNDWNLIVYGVGFSGPLSCEGKACMCICKGPGLFSDQLEQCNSAGVCKKTESYDVRMSSSLLIDGPTEVRIRSLGENIIEVGTP